ncbi:MAG: hypothetical protein ACSHYF_03640 [Verrucomicrobiaceae bacterium]
MKSLVTLLAGLGLTFLLSSCGEYQSTGYYGGYNSGYNSGYGYNSVAHVGIIRTSNSYWGYDPYRRCYYDYRTRQYYDHLNHRYHSSAPTRHSHAVYPSGYRKGRTLSAPSYLARAQNARGRHSGGHSSYGNHSTSHPSYGNSRSSGSNRSYGSDPRGSSHSRTTIPGRTTVSTRPTVIQRPSTPVIPQRQGLSGSIDARAEAARRVAAAKAGPSFRQTSPPAPRPQPSTSPTLPQPNFSNRPSRATQSPSPGNRGGGDDRGDRGSRGRR